MNTDTMSYLKKLIAISRELEDIFEHDTTETPHDSVVEEVERLTMAEMHKRLGAQSIALKNLITNISAYREAKYSVADIAHRLKDCGIYSKSDASTLCKTCDRVHTNLDLLAEHSASLRDQLDKARYEVE